MMGKKKKKAEVDEVIKKGSDFVKTSLALGYDVWKRAKVKALETGLTLAEITERALQDYLKKEKKKE
ncbi:hypothetical protein ES703_00795 [subsurface metagenome]